MNLKLNKFLEGGFSMIEVMISVAILAGMSLVITATVSRVLTSKAKVESRDEIIHALRTGLGKMTDDLSQAFLVNSAFKGKEKLYQTGMKGMADKIVFSTLSNFHYVQDSKDTDQVEVGYFLRDEEGVSMLMRSQTQHLTEEIEKEGAAEYVLLDHVKEFALEYYDSQKEEWVKEWDTESISSQNKLPQAVKITLIVVEVDEEDSDKVIKEFQISTTAGVDLYKNEINF